MRKTARWLAPLLMLLVLFAGCQSQEGKSSLAPYDLEEGQEELLSLLGMRDTAQLFSYQCPQGTLAVTASRQARVEAGIFPPPWGEWSSSVPSISKNKAFIMASPPFYWGKVPSSRGSTPKRSPQSARP